MEKAFSKLTNLVYILILTMILLVVLVFPAFAGAWVSDIDNNNNNELNILNYDENKYVSYPVFAEGNGVFYAAWTENNGTANQVRVKQYVDGVWSFIDGGGTNGLNYTESDDASQLSIVVSNGVLYVAWAEFHSTNPNGFFYHVKKYNGTPGSWSFIDGGTIYGLRKNMDDTNCRANNLVIADYNDQLVAAWADAIYGQSNQYITVGLYNGSSWSIIGESLNYSENEASNPAMTVLGSDLFVVWDERNAAYQTNIRVKKYNGSWSSADNNTPLDYNTAISGDHQVKLCVSQENNCIYASWQEKDANDIYQLRVKKYSGGGWSFIDGGTENGLNYDTNQSAFIKSVAIWQNKLYVNWYEDYNGKGQLRIKEFNDIDSSWIFFDDNGLTGGSGAPTGLNFYPFENGVYNSRIGLYNTELYLMWCEDSKVYVKKYDPDFTVSSDAVYLSSLGISDGTLNPSYQSSIKQYNALVENSVSNISLTSTLKDANATVLLNGVETTSGNPSDPLNLEVGVNKSKIEVISYRGVLMNKYIVNTYRLTVDNKILLAPTEDVSMDLTWGYAMGLGDWYGETYNWVGSELADSVYQSALKFDYSFLDISAILGAELRVYIPEGGISGTPFVNVSCSEDTSWNQIDYSELDVSNQVISNTTVSTTGWNTFGSPTMLSFVQNSTDQNISIFMDGNTTDDVWFKFNSTEADANQPVLAIEYQISNPPSIDINTGLTTDEDSYAIVSNTMLQTSAQSYTALEITYTINITPANGSLKKESSMLTVGDTFTQADIDGGSISYMPNLDATGADSFDFTVSSPEGSTSGIFAITINAINDAPSISGGSFTLVGTIEDNVSGATLVSDIIAGLTYSDPDTGALQGIAITAATGNGTWEFSGDGSTWTYIGSVADSSALLLSSAMQLRYVPDGQNGETAMLTFRAWDQTCGFNSSVGSPSFADTSVNGGETAFSVGTAQAVIIVTSVNDAPFLSGSYTLSSTDEETPSTVTSVLTILGGAAISYSDPDSGAISGIAVTAVIGTGTWQYSTDGSNWTNFGAVSSSYALLLSGGSQVRYVPDGTDSETASFTFRAWDQTSGSASANGVRQTADTTINGGSTAFSAGTAMVNLSVTAVNDAPQVSAPANISVIEDEASLVTGISFVDIDCGSGVLTATFSVGSGTLTATTGGGVIVSGSGTDSLELNGSLADLNSFMDNNNVQYITSLNANGNVTLNITINDNGNTGSGGALSGSGSVNLAIIAVNDAPSLSGSYNLSETDEETPSTGTFVSTILGDDAISYSDPDPGDLSGIAVTAVTGYGSWQYSTDGTNWTDFGAVSGGSALLLSSGSQVRYVPDGIDSETASFTFRAWDQTSGSASAAGTPQNADATTYGGTTSFSAGTAMASITVTGINDPPTLTATGQDPTFTEGDSSPGADLFSGVAISTVELGQAIAQINLTITNVVDGTSEILNIDGVDVALTNGNSVTTAILGANVSVSVSGSIATVTISKTGGISAASGEMLVDGLAYQNLSDNPSVTFNRVVTITQIKDNGGTANGGNDTTILNVISTISLIPVNDPPVISNIEGVSSVIAGNGACILDAFRNATVTNVDSVDYNGGSLYIHQSLGTTNGSFSVDGTTATSGGDGTISAGETIAVGGVAIGTVHAANDGQSGNTLTISFNSANATSSRLTALLRSICYSAPSSLGDRQFNLTINDGDGIANGGVQDVSTAFTIRVTPNPPVISNLNGDTVNYTEDDAPILIDADSNATVTDADSANFNGGELLVAVVSGKVETEDTLGIDTTDIVTLAGTTAGSDVTVDGIIVGTLLNDLGTGNDLRIGLGSNATSGRTTILIRSLTYHNSNTIYPNMGERTIQITVRDAPEGVSCAQTTITLTVTVTAVNDLPVIFVNGLDLDEDSPATIVGQTIIQVTDEEQGPEELVFTLIEPPVRGALHCDGNFLASGDQFTQADIDNNLLIYTLKPNQTGLDSFSFSVSDGQGGTVDGVLNIEVAGVPPAAPSTPKLTNDSDTGISSADNITNDTTPTFTGTAEPYSNVKLYASETEIGSGTTDADGVWSITANALSNGDHGITAVATDLAGNTGEASTSLVITVDVTPPVGSITVNNGAEVTLSPELNLSLNATDSIGVRQMRFSSDGNNWSAWESYAAAKTWTVNGQGQHKVYVMYHDIAGNNSIVYSASIVVVPQVTNFIATSDLNGAINLSWNNPAAYWEKTRIVRNTSRYPMGPEDGEIIYEGQSSAASDSGLAETTYYYSAFSYYRGCITEPVKISATPMAVSTKKKISIRPSADGTVVQTAANYRNALATRWNDNGIVLGKGVSGRIGDLWLAYKNLFGTEQGQIPLDVNIDRAQLVLRLKDYPMDSDKPIRIKIYRVIDPDNLGQPHFGTQNGLRTGLNYLYRDNRIGYKVPWKNGVENISQLFAGVQPDDSIEFVPTIYHENSLDTIVFDVKSALQAWLDGAPNQGWYLTVDGELEVGEEIAFYGVTAENEAYRPTLQVVYADSSIDLSTPEPVTGLTATPENGRVRLDWTNPSFGCFGVKVVRKVGAVPFGPDDGELVFDGWSTTCTNTGLIDDTPYYYSVFSYNNLWNYSVKEWIKAVPGTPLAPLLNSAVSGVGVVELSWGSVENANTYRVYRSCNDEEPILLIQTSELFYTDHNVEPKTYTYWVTGVKGELEGQRSESQQATPTATQIIPVAPSVLSIGQVNATSIELSWTDNSSNETGYVVERQVAGNEWEEIITVSFNHLSYLDTGLLPAMTYTYRIKAINPAGSSGVAGPVSATTTNEPVAPETLNWSIISAHQIRLEWADSPNETEYRLEILNEAGEQLRTVNILSETNCYHVTGLLPNTDYRFRLIAINQVGESTAVETEILQTGISPKTEPF